MKSFWVRTCLWIAALALITVTGRSEEPGFSLSQLQVPPRPKVQAKPVFPAEMRRAGLEGNVLVDFVVDTDGLVKNAKVVHASNPAFAHAAVDAVGSWRFEPALQRGQPVNTHMQVPIWFTLGLTSSTWLVEKQKNPEKLPPEYRWDVGPVPIQTAFPVYPFEALHAGISGKFVVRFLVETHGRVAQCDVSQAPTPEFGHAVRAMLDCWRFKPAMKADHPCLALLSMEVDFNPNKDQGTVPVSQSARKLLLELKKTPPAIAGLADLDAKLKPVMQSPPVFPSKMAAGEARTGQAVVEFFIDEHGDALLPRVISCSRPEFGYAAAQAAATWWFDPPRKGGKPTSARVQVPFEFVFSEPPAANSTQPSLAPFTVQTE